MHLTSILFTGCLSNDWLDDPTCQFICLTKSARGYLEFVSLARIFAIRIRIGQLDTWHATSTTVCWRQTGRLCVQAAPRLNAVTAWSLKSNGEPRRQIKFIGRLIFMQTRWLTRAAKDRIYAKVQKCKLGLGWEWTSQLHFCVLAKASLKCMSKSVRLDMNNLIQCPEMVGQALAKTACP